MGAFIMKRFTKLIVVFFVIIGALMFNFSSGSMEGNAVQTINNIGKVVFIVSIGIMVYDAFRSKKE